MEEESLLKERLQAITDKRRIREDISHKRRDIEEEKLKLQYIKKKSLREQWLMDGLQTEEEREAMKIQAQDELQRSTQLQSNILRMEKEIEELEAQELELSANEEAILKRLKEVERTTEDIIKELSAHPFSDVSWPSPLPEDSLSDIFMEMAPPQTRAAQDHGPPEPKRATFAMEISVELDKRTGKTQVISTASIKPNIIQEKGLKVYEDGRKSVYALPPGGSAGEVAEMTPRDVEELLRQATDWSGDVQYHQPVYAAPFTGTSRPSTPQTSSMTTSPSPVHSKRIGTPNPASSRPESILEVYPEISEVLTLNNDANNHLISSSNIQDIGDIDDSPYAILGSVQTCSRAATSPTQPDHKNTESNPLEAIHRYNFAKSINIDKTSAFCVESTTDNFSQNESPSPTFSRFKLGVKEYQGESDRIPTKSSPKNVDQTLHCVNNFSDLVSEEICTPIQPHYHNTSSLQATHRYELELIKRSMNVCGTSPTNITNQNVMQLGRSGMELEKDMTPALACASASARSEGLSTKTKPVHKNEEISPLLSTQRQELNVNKSSGNLHETLQIKKIDFSHSKTPSPALGDRKVDSGWIPTKDNMTRQNVDNQKAALVSVRASSDWMPTQQHNKNTEMSSPFPQRYDLDIAECNLDRNSPTYTESLANSLLEELDPGAVTMVFMGYENVDEEEDPIQAELVVVGNSDEEDFNEEDSLSIYHPKGYTSKVFQPVVGVAKVTDGRDFHEELQWGEPLPQKPTFRHKEEKSTPCLKNVTLQGNDNENMEAFVTER